MTAAENTSWEISMLSTIQFSKKKLLIVRLHTCDRRRNVVGLTEIFFPDLFSWLFFTIGLSGACRSNLTRVSPTHKARYLLKKTTQDEKLG